MLKKPISILGLITAISVSSLFIIVSKFEPCVGYSAVSFCSEINTGSLVFLQSNIFLFTTSMVSLILYVFRSFSSINLSKTLAASLRQGVLFALFVQFLMISQIFGLLEIWNTVLVFAILATIDSILGS